MYTIGQVSAMFSLPVSTLRYYDKEGFFPNLKRKGNIRYFIAANYDADTDFVEEYLSAFTQVLGEDFTTQLKQDTDALYDVVLNITGENSSGEAISIMSDLEILVTERGDVYGVMG